VKGLEPTPVERVLQAARAWRAAESGEELATAEGDLAAAVDELGEDLPDGVAELAHLLEPLQGATDGATLRAVADGLDRAEQVAVTGLPETTRRLADLLATRRPRTANLDGLARLLHDIRHKLLKREGREEIRGGKVVRFIPVTPEVLEVVADALNAAIVHLGSHVAKLEVDPTDLVIFRSNYPTAVSQRAIDLVMGALRARLDRVADGQEIRVIAIGPDAKLEAMSDAQLARVGLQRRPLKLGPMPDPTGEPIHVQPGSTDG
jgi:hypothetical protein